MVIWNGVGKMRLDNTNPEVQFYFDLPNFGPINPIDVCLHCYNLLTSLEPFTIDHPDYEDDEYYCIECGELLVDGDN